MIAGLALGAVGCRTPTSIALTVTSDVNCADLKGVAITTTSPGASESAAPTTTTTQCTSQPGGSRIGTLVIVPSGGNDGEIAVRVVAGIDRPVEECSAASNYQGCIVARRIIRFQPHVELTLPVELHINCKSVACDATSTCVNSGCRPAKIDDPGECLECGSDGGVDSAKPDVSGDAPITETGGCTASQKNCDGKCVEITDPAYGCTAASCSPCTGAPGASFACVGGTCTESMCKAGFKDCGGTCQPTDAAHGCNAASCAACPSDNGIAGCAAGACSIKCNTGYKLCGGKCVNIGDPTYGCTPASCDNSACPKTGTVVCSAGACVLGSCGAGTKACGGSCVPTDSTNGCGDVTRCTPCAAGESCAGGPPTTCQCVPEPKSTTCGRVQCGITKNNCGASVDCGAAACVAPKTCGGGGVANTCGCKPSGSPCDGVSCGTLTDSCGTSVSCGCTGANTCGGGGMPGKCGCTVTNPCTGGKCGTFADGCGGSITCTCSGANTCGGGGAPGICGCAPEPLSTTCSFQVCGSAVNNCGTTVSCGGCPGPKPRCCLDSCVCSTCACP